MATYTDKYGTVREVGTNNAVGGKTDNRTVSGGGSSSKSSSVKGAGYGKGNSYSGRETEYVFDDNGKTTFVYSNATNYEDARKEAAKKGLLSGENARLKSATSYLARGDGSGFSNRGEDMYSEGQPTNKGYENAMNYNNDILNRYGLDINGRRADGNTEQGTYEDANNRQAQMIEQYNNTVGLTGALPGYRGMTAADIKAEYDDIYAQQKAASNQQLRLLARQYDQQKEDAQKEYDRQEQQNYINYMMGQKNINQALAAQGISGGASETALLRQLSDYEGLQNDTAAQREQALRDLELGYLTNQTAYNTELANNYLSLRQSMLSAVQAANQYENAYYQWAAEFNQAKTEEERSYAYNMMLYNDQQKQNALEEAMKIYDLTGDGSGLEALGYSVPKKATARYSSSYTPRAEALEGDSLYLSGDETRTLPLVQSIDRNSRSTSGLTKAGEDAYNLYKALLK